MSNQGKAYVCAAGAVFLWSTVASAFKLTLRHLDHLQLLALSACFSCLALFALLLARGRIGDLGRCTALDLLRSLGLGVLNPFLYYLVLFKAYDLLPAQEAQPLNFIWPIVMVLLAAPLLGQAVTLRDMAALVVSFAGVVVIATHGRVFSWHMNSPLGVALAVGSSLVWSLFFLLNARDKRREEVKLFLNFLFGSIFALAAMAMWSSPPELRWAGWGGALYVGLFEMGFTFVLWLKALRLSSSTARVSNLVYLAPFISLVFIHCLVGERIGAYTIAGLLLITGGIALQRSQKAPSGRALSRTGEAPGS